MSDEKAKIILKEGLKKREIGIGGKFVKVEPGTPVEVPLADLQLWLNTGRFDQVNEPVSDLPKELPGRAALIAAGITADNLTALDKTALVALPKIGETTADQILKFIADKTGGNQ
ncbi:MAG TPA: hypothetical protein PKY82_02010 [Pyrinomonadaceae bacterium]|nr:hypothetical protein [Pyrinomonadaceae bacterium]